MANTGKVKILAEYQDRTKKGMNQTSSAVRRLKGAVASLAAAWGVREVAMFSTEIAKLAAQMDITSGAFDKLARKAGTTAPAELEKMRDAVGGTLTDLELMQKVGAAVDAGLTFDQSIIALQFLRRYSLAFGKDFNQLVQTIFTGLQRGSVLFLDDAGIILSASDDMFKGLGDLEKKAALVGEAIRLMGVKMDHLPDITDNVITQTDRLTVAWERLKIAIGDLAKEPVEGVLQSLTAAASGAASILEGGGSREGAGGDLKPNMFGARERTMSAFTAAEVRLLEQIDWTNQNKGLKEYARLLEEIQENRKEESKASDLFSRRMNSQTVTADEVTDALIRQIAAIENIEDVLDPFVVSGAIFQMGEKLPPGLKKTAEELHNLLVEAVDLRQFLRDESGLQVAPAGQLMEIQAAKKIIDEVLKLRAEEEKSAKLREKSLADTARIRGEIDREALAASLEMAGDFADQEADVWHEFEAERFMNRQAVTDGLVDLERRATDDQIKIQEAFLRAEGQANIKRLRALGATEEQIGQVAAAYEALIDKVGKDETVKRILLVFNADASQVKTAADLAHYSLGLLVEQLGNLDPAIASVIKGMEQIVVGAMTGGAAGWASVFAGGMSILSTGLSFFANRAAEAEKERRRLTEAIIDAADVEGKFASQLAGVGEKDIRRQFKTKISELRAILGDSGSIFVDFETFAFDARKTLDEVYKHLSGNRGRDAERVVHEIERIEEMIHRFGGATFTFADAMAEFNHALSMTGEQDPAVKLDMFGEALHAVGIALDDLTDLSLRDQRRIKEMIAGFQRDITAAELKERRDQADIIIKAIRDQGQAVRDALVDQETATKQATLRAVRLTFDVQEQALRASFFPRLKGAAGDPFETQKIILEAQSEIALLQLSEQTATVNALSKIRQQFDQAEAANTEITERMIQATLDAAANLALSFEEALVTEIGKLDFHVFMDIASVTTRGTAAIIDVLEASRSVLLGEQVATKAAVNQQGIQAQNYFTTTIGRLDALISATNAPAWTIGKTFGGAGQAGTTVNVQIGSVGGGQSSSPAALWRGGLEDIIIDSIHDGRVGQTINRIWHGSGKPAIPSTIRV